MLMSAQAVQDCCPSSGTSNTCYIVSDALVQQQSQQQPVQHLVWLHTQLLKVLSEHLFVWMCSPAI